MFWLLFAPAPFSRNVASGWTYINNECMCSPFASGAKKRASRFVVIPPFLDSLFQSLSYIIFYYPITGWAIHSHSPFWPFSLSLSQSLSLSLCVCWAWSLILLINGEKKKNKKRISLLSAPPARSSCTCTSCVSWWKTTAENLKKKSEESPRGKNSAELFDWLIGRDVHTRKKAIKDG